MKKKRYCIDCGVEISSKHPNSPRCRSCSIKEVWTRKEWREKVSKKISKTLTGKKRPDKVKQKISKTLKKLTAEGKHHIPKLKGEQHWNWRGGISREEYGFDFNNTLKTKIRESYNNRCVWCGIKQGRLNEKLIVHHINHNKKDNREENLIPMCRSCHIKLHHIENRLESYGCLGDSGQVLRSTCEDESCYL